MSPGLQGWGWPFSSSFKPQADGLNDAPKDGLVHQKEARWALAGGSLEAWQRVAVSQPVSSTTGFTTQARLLFVCSPLD